MKKFQSLDDALFNDNAISQEHLNKIYGGVMSKDTKLTGTTMDCATHTAGQPGEQNNDGCDNTPDDMTIKDPS